MADRIATPRSASDENGAVRSDSASSDPYYPHDSQPPTAMDLVDEYGASALMPRVVDMQPDAWAAPAVPTTRVKEIRVITVPTHLQAEPQHQYQSQSQYQSQYQSQSQPQYQHPQQLSALPPPTQQLPDYPASAEALVHQKSITVRHAASASDLSRFNFVRPPQQMIIGINQYIFLKVIGYGSTGTVWKCLGQTAKILVAAKVIDWSVSHLEAHDRLNVMREVSTISRLHHPNIVQLIELVEDPVRDFTYIVMELVQGCDLLTFINSTPRVVEKEGKIIVAQIILALNYCHDHGIIHRDLKPENILVQDNGIVKLCDFGLCCTSYTVKAENQLICGSPGYIAPEVVFAEVYDHTCDYWGLGCLTYSMFTKLIPFGANWIDEYERLVIKQVDPFLKFPTGLSEDLIHFVINLMRTVPQHRLSKQMLCTHPWIAKYFTKYEQKAKGGKMVAKGKMFASIGMTEALRFLGAGAGVA
eukprot:TRINITY_DN8883_c0_g1_i2.p1 TRINITY_DN8883_c0_g1~~TRINITY_DN8883_c0_g1_i2.p1  ORF type:complete len:473 (+),score=99.82 TRINITY_DN8883_c0_g1_i2:46-1464(+)